MQNQFDAASRAQIISEALPSIQRLHGQTVVVKYGGAAMLDENLKAAVMGDIALLHFVGIRPIVVHGGGPEISNLCKQLGIETNFVQGLRVTDAQTMRVTEMVLGQIGKGIAHLLGEKGAPAVSISGKDGNLMRAKKFVDATDETLDWGFVGEIEHVEPALIETLHRGGFVPIIQPIAPDESGQTYNINADFAAAAIAQKLGAAKLLLLTDVAGVYRDFSDKTSLIAEMTVAQSEELIQSGALNKGMIPKVRCAVEAVRGGVGRAHIVDGRAPHSLLIELFSDAGSGTMIY
ncbi:N-acetylglutamate kinase [Abditibacterium utsteinense]|uniref:Acetylglutamate kinase n=1 Tax=Abditibacterium utsteinense TaxID=1960156 RepID=A0A2S8ST97_9BACT|nr:acetylglutamate kinase [Abditibacterium utsteinense]PQV64020.1 N-acetylglutamate kinase [Abditibacterium utsteinense]